MGKGPFPAAVGGAQKFGQDCGVIPQEIAAREIDLGVGAVVVGVTGKDVELNPFLLQGDLFIHKVEHLGIDLSCSQRGEVIPYFFGFDLVQRKAIGSQHDVELGQVIGVETDCLSGEILDLAEAAAAKSNDAQRRSL